MPRSPASTRSPVHRSSREHDTFWQEWAYRDEVRASRLVSLLLLLQSRGQLTAGELAKELEVSERTVHRDVEALSASGVPIYAERGAHGGIRLVDGYRTRLTGMTGEEAEALFLSGMPGPAAELGLGTVMAAAQLKVLASLPPELRARATRLVERFHLDAGDWFHTGQPVPHLGALSDAVWNSTRIAIEYDRGGGAVRRVIEPLGLVLKAGTWYVVAGVEGQIRTYRISRVVAAEPSADLFERPAGFDLAGYWAEAAAAYERDSPRVEVVVRVRPDRVDRLRIAVGHAILDAAEYLTEPDPDGWLRLRLRMDWPDEAPGALLRAGRWVEVLEPPDIRARVADTARAIAARYAGDVG
jgi:predicted DNA-binding transcriptional regulator YafY